MGVHILQRNIVVVDMVTLLFLNNSVLPVLVSISVHTEHRNGLGH